MERGSPRTVQVLTRSKDIASFDVPQVANKLSNNDSNFHEFRGGRAGTSYVCI